MKQATILSSVASLAPQHFPTLFVNSAILLRGGGGVTEHEACVLQLIFETFLMLKLIQLNIVINATSSYQVSVTLIGF
jgi:hypothetical protein